MHRPLKILLLEDNPADAGMIKRVLLKGKINCEFHLTMTEKGLLQALEEYYPDVILSDNTMPQFNATEALKIIRELSPHIPFILVTGTISEEFAANIIRQGADDYILKDRMIRLPGAIKAALNQRKTEKEITDYKNALDQSAIVSITDQKGIIKYVNNNFCKISGYTAEELLEQDHRIINSEYHPKSYIKDLWTTIAKGKIWRGEFRNKAKDGSFYWVDATIVPFLNNKDKPVQYLAIRNDITQKKMLQQQILEQKIQEQKKIARAIIRSQEQERNHMGQELHDNVNQILAGTKMYLGMAGKDEKVKELIRYPVELIDSAIREIRSLSSKNVTPLKDVKLNELLELLINDLNKNTRIKSTFIYDIKMEDIDDDLKLNIYRVMQAQVNNIIKHAAPENVSVSVKAKNKTIYLTVTDDGKGFDMKKRRMGIGISNMMNRVESFNGTMKMTSSPGKGCKTEIEVPY